MKFYCSLFILTILPSLSFALSMQNAQVSIENRKEYGFILIEKKSTSLFSTQFKRSHSQREYAEWVKEMFAVHGPQYGYQNGTAEEVLLNHRKLIKEADWMDPIEQQMELDSLDKVLSFFPQSLRKIDMLEAFLHDAQNKKFPLKDRPSEFCSYILENASKLKVYFYTELNDYGGISCARYNDLVEVDLKKGWRFRSHLHSHPYNFSNPYGDFGPIAPSSPDISYYKKSLIPNALITNGIETLSLSPTQYSKLYN